ncbi:MAG: ABC transporter permease [Propionibacteriales bacterium]|nr:ABC transporter permease [Propionibacteriales bacterium]
MADIRSPVGRVPGLLVAPAVIGALLMVIPLLGLVARTPWTELVGILTSAGTGQSLGLSLLTATLATLVALILGVPLAVVLARPGLPGAGLLRALVTVPLVLPPVVGGVALFAARGRTGLRGAPAYELTGWALPFSTAAVVVAQTFVAMPFLVLGVEGALRGLDDRLLDAAATLGATPWHTFWTITLPLVRPGLVSGAVLAWARALGEFGATITFAGNFPGTTRTLPLQVYTSLQSDAATAIGLSMIMLAVSIMVLVAARGRWGRAW